MMRLREIIKSVAPEFVKDIVRSRRALEEHEKTRPVWQRIDQELLEDARLVADVFELLDRMPKNSVVAEIGVAAGGLSKQILRRNNPRKLYLIDPWDVSDVTEYSESSFNKLKSELRSEIESGIVELKRGYSYNILPTFPSDSLDWIYVDGAHDYDSVKKDLEQCYAIVKSGGIIAGHDYVRWVSPTARYGVVEAVNEFANKTRSNFVFLTNQLDKHDSFALQIRK